MYNVADWSVTRTATAPCWPASDGDGDGGEFGLGCTYLQSLLMHTSKDYKYLIEIKLR